MHKQEQDHDRAALAAALASSLTTALDAVQSDDAGKLGSLLQTQSWIGNEIVHADSESAVQDRLSKGCPQEMAAMPAIQIASLERRGLQGEVGDTLLEIAKKSGKTAISAKLGVVDEVRICTCTCVCACVRACMCACMHACVHVCVHVCLCACVHVCMHGHMCAHVSACIDAQLD